MLRCLRSLQLSKFSGLKTNYLKISRFKLTKQGTYPFYSSDKVKQFLFISIGMTASALFSIYVFSQRRTLANLIPLVVILGACYAFQRRVSQTVKKMVIDKTGEAVEVSTYGLLGLDIFHIESRVGIQQFKGISQNKWDRGVVVQGGGGRVRPFKFYFHENGIIDKTVFDAVMRRTFIKYSDIL